MPPKCSFCKQYLPCGCYTFSIATGQKLPWFKTFWRFVCGKGWQRDERADIGVL